MLVECFNGSCTLPANVLLFDAVLMYHANLHTCTHAHACTHVYFYVCFSTSAHVHMYTHTHAHTHTHTHTTYTHRCTRLKASSPAVRSHIEHTHQIRTCITIVFIPSHTHTHLFCCTSFCVHTCTDVQTH